jgi:hypothetical protein
LPGLDRREPFLVSQRRANPSSAAASEWDLKQETGERVECRRGQVLCLYRWDVAYRKQATAQVRES